MFKTAFIIMAPDGDPQKHRATISTGRAQLTALFIELANFDQAVEVAEDLVQNKGVQSIYLCPGFTHQAVARIATALAGRAAVNVARGDGPSSAMVADILAKEEAGNK